MSVLQRKLTAFCTGFMRAAAKKNLSGLAVPQSSAAQIVNLLEDKEPRL